MKISLLALAEALEKTFGQDDCDETRAVRNLADAGIVNGRNKNAARKILHQLADCAVCYSFSTLTGVSKYFKIARVGENKDEYRFFRYNAVFSR